RSSPATKVNISGARRPHFGAHGQILFQEAEGNKNYLEQIDPDGTHQMKVVPYPISDFQSISPSRRWAVAPMPDTLTQSVPTMMLIPLDGGAPHQICFSYCVPRWSTDGKFLFVPVEDASRAGAGRSLAIPL